MRTRSLPPRHTGTRGSHGPSPAAAATIPVRWKSIFCCTDLGFGCGKRPGLHPPWLPRKKGGMASGVKQADKSPSQVFRFPPRFYLRYDSP